MAVNKVVYGGQTLVDLTTDTVTADTLAEGVTAHDKSGAKITGTMQATKPTQFTNLYDPANVKLKTVMVYTSGNSTMNYGSDNNVNVVRIPYQHKANEPVALRVRGISTPVRDRQSVAAFVNNGVIATHWAQLSSSVSVSYDEYGDTVITFKDTFVSRAWNYLDLNFQYQGINSSASTAFTGPIITINEPIGNGGCVG